MVRARMTIICNNCGEIATNMYDENLDCTLICRDGKYIYCRNCCTLHSLEDILPTKNQIDKRQEKAMKKMEEFMNKQKQGGGDGK